MPDTSGAETAVVGDTRVGAAAAGDHPPAAPSGGRDETGPASRRWTWRRLSEPFVGAGAVVVFLVAWQLVVRYGGVPTQFITSPTKAAGALGHLLVSSSFWVDMRVSGEEFGLGVGIALVVGVGCGLLYGRYAYFRAALQPFILTLNAMPQIALVPVFILAFGVGLESKIVLIAISAVTPIWLNTETGVRGTDPQLVRLARSYHASEVQIFRTINLPAALPAIISGLRVAVGKSLIALVVGELFASVAGIGHSLVNAANGYDMPDMYAYLVVVTAIGVLLALLLNRVEKHFRYH